MVGSEVHPVFVQFPHPGEEHNPGKAKRHPWNRGNHRRKFLRCNGRYLDPYDSSQEAPLVFWGEWEAPSYVSDRWPEDGELPRFLHEPVWEYPTDGGARQNTDPWVFGDCFLYSNCKQLTQPALRALPRGSVILFGSGRGGNFILDTVFVVKDMQRLIPRQPPQIDEAFRVCTIEALVTDSACSGEAFVLYRGATYRDPIGGMYSFVPCRRADRAGQRFRRPAIVLASDYLNPKSTQSPSGVKKPRSVEQVRQQWDCVRSQVIDAGCLLGVWFSTPRFDGGFSSAK